jgi:hypothetical protein
MNLLDTLVAVERTLWKNDIAEYERTLTDDATLVFVETGPISKATAIDEIRRMNAAVAGAMSASTGRR